MCVTVCESCRALVRLQARKGDDYLEEPRARIIADLKHEMEERRALARNIISKMPVFRDLSPEQIVSAHYCCNLSGLAC